MTFSVSLLAYSRKVDEIMNNAKKPILILGAFVLLTPLLFSCASDNQKGDGEDSSSTDAKLSIEDTLGLLESLNEIEGDKAASVVVKESETKNDDVTETNETFTIGKDSSSTSEGTIVHTYKGEITKQDTFQRRRLKKVDTIANGNQTTTTNRFYMVTDYKDNSIKVKDEASVFFMFQSEEEATAAGYSDYVLDEDYKTAAGAQAIGSLHDTILNKILKDTSFSAQTEAYFKVETKGETTSYTYHASYSVDGDLNDTIKNEVQTTFYVKENALTSYTYQYDVFDINNENENDLYHTQYYKEATITYGERKDITSSIDVDDYFLSTVNEVELYSSGIPGKGYEIENPSAIESTTNYISAAAKSYEPSTAVDVSLYPYKSSAPAVVRLDDELFNVRGVGEATLTFLYIGKRGPNQYAYKDIKVEVKILGAKPKDFIIVESENYQSDNNLYIGQTYTFNVSVTPSQSEQDFTYEVSDHEALEVTRSEKTLTIVPKKASDSVSITIRSVVQDGISKTYTYRVAPDPTETYKAYLTSHTFDAKKRLVGKEEWPMEWGYYYTDLTFKEDGTGEVKYTPYEADGSIEESKKITWTFEYTVFLAKITFEFKTYNAEKKELVFTKGMIRNEGARLEIDDAAFKTMIFEVK